MSNEEQEIDDYFPEVYNQLSLIARREKVPCLYCGADSLNYCYAPIGFLNIPRPKYLSDRGVTLDLMYPVCGNVICDDCDESNSIQISKRCEFHENNLKPPPTTFAEIKVLCEGTYNEPPGTPDQSSNESGALPNPIDPSIKIAITTHDENLESLPPLLSPKHNANTNNPSLPQTSDIDNNLQMAEWKSDFYQKMNSQDSGPNSSWITAETYIKIKSFCINVHSVGFNNFIKSSKAKLKEMKSTMDPNSQLISVLEKELKGTYKSWNSRFLYLPDTDQIIHRSNAASMDTMTTVCHSAQFFDIIVSGHIQSGACQSQAKTNHVISRKYGKSIPQSFIRLCVQNCPCCILGKNRKTAPAGSKPITSKIFMERIQMDCIDMQNFVPGLETVFEKMNDEEKEILHATSPLTWDYDESMLNEGDIPRYILNIADCASKVGKSYAISNKRPHTIAWCLLDFISIYGIPKIIQTDNSREFICMVQDNKYAKVSLAGLTDDEFRESQKLVSPKPNPFHNIQHPHFFFSNIIPVRKLAP